MTASMLVASPSKIDWRNKDIRVPSFILSGAPSLAGRLAFLSKEFAPLGLRVQCLQTLLLEHAGETGGGLSHQAGEVAASRCRAPPRSVQGRLGPLGLTTSNLDAMLEWYRNVLGMTLNHRTQALGGPRYSPWMSAAFVSNDEVNHRIAIFEMPDLVVDPDKPRHARLQHVAFEYETLDELLGTYVRLKGLGILPVMCADQGVQTVIYYSDPDQNSVELNVNNYGNEWTATHQDGSAEPGDVRAGEDGGGPQGRRLALGSAPAHHRRRVRTRTALRRPGPSLKSSSGLGGFHDD